MWVGLALAGSAGFVDAVGYLVLLRTFVAHLSGDSIATGMHAAQGDWHAAFHRAFPIPLFIAGVFVATVLAEALTRRNVRATFAVPLGLEAVLLLAFVIAGTPVVRDGRLEPGATWAFYGLAALPAMAMGIQSALLWRVAGKRVRTTFITGLLVSLVEEAVKYLFWHFGRPGRRSYLLRASPGPPSVRLMLFLLGLWVGYVLGAVAGTLAHLRWSLPCLLAPVGGVLVALVIDLFHPLTPPE